MQGFEWDRLRRLEQESHGEEASHRPRGRCRRRHRHKAKKSVLVAGIAPPSSKLIVDSGSMNVEMNSNGLPHRPGYAAQPSLSTRETTNSGEFDVGEFIHVHKFD